MVPNGIEKRLLQAGTGPLPRQANVAIVGGGLAGLELAKELERRGVRDVIVLEAGPAADFRHVNVKHDDAVTTTMCFSPRTDKHFHRPFGSLSGRHYTLNSGLRRRLGGRSLYWHGVVLPLESWALREPWWPSEVTTDLTGNRPGAFSLYDEVMLELQAWQGRGVPRYADAPEAVEVGAERLVRTPSACRAVGAGRWQAYSPLDYWSEEPGGEDSADAARFVCDIEVVAVEVQGGAATGVFAARAGSREVFRVGADTVVLCAAAVENARLAIQALSETGALTTARLGGVADHIVQGFLLKVDSASPRLPEYLLRPGSYVAPARAEHRSYLRFDIARPKPGEILVDVRTTGEQVRRPESFVECRTDGAHPWPTFVHTSTCAQDDAVIAGQREMLAEFWSALAHDLRVPAKALEFEEFGRQVRTNTTVLPEFVAALPPGRPLTWVSLLGTEDHEGGTLPLGSVLDERHQLAGVPNLYAAGPTSFPRLGAANPSLTSLALAHRLAALLAGSGRHSSSTRRAVQ